MKIDILDFMLPDPNFGEGYHFEARAHPMYNVERDGWIWHIKGKKGYPWDANVIGDSVIYQVITEGEKGWEDPSSYKQFTSSSFRDSHGGIAWAPRFLEEGVRSLPLVTPDSSYATFFQGEQVRVQDLGGPTVARVEGPFTEKIGALDPMPVIEQSYQWGRNLENMEVNIYGQGRGWLRWRLYETEGGKYTLKQESLFDRLEKGGPPELVFPGSLP